MQSSFLHLGKTQGSAHRSAAAESRPGKGTFVITVSPRQVRAGFHSELAKTLLPHISYLAGSSTPDLYLFLR